EIELPIRAPPAVLGIAFKRQLAAELVRVISLDPGRVGIASRLLFVNEGNEGWADPWGIPTAKELVYVWRESIVYGHGREAVTGGIPVKTEGALVEFRSIGRLPLPNVTDAHVQQQGGP